MASYKLRIKTSAEKELGRISRDQIPKIVAAVDALADQPFPQGTTKLSGSQNSYRIRVGDYRVIYLVHLSTKTVDVQKIRHRKDVYR